MLKLTLFIAPPPPPAFPLCPSINYVLCDKSRVCLAALALMNARISINYGRGVAAPKWARIFAQHSAGYGKPQSVAYFSAALKRGSPCRLHSLLPFLTLLLSLLPACSKKHFGTAFLAHFQRIFAIFFNGFFFILLVSLSLRFFVYSFYLK